MNYKKAVYFKNGDILTITEKEAETIKAGLNAGAKWIEVQTEFIAADHIGRIGNHHATAQVEMLEGEQKKTDLKIKADETLKLETPEEIRKWVNG